MAYFAPYIDGTGLHLPTYNDILAYETEQFLSVYGQTIYTGDDSADTQWIGIFSLMINDAFNTAQLSINARSPGTAVGADLDTIVKINGITRKSATASTANLTLGGIPGTVIQNGVVQDTNGNLWTVPTVTILNSGSVNITAQCQVVGAITALPGTINLISTPTYGWNSVTNASAAIMGQPVENDSVLRSRQAISVSLSSRTIVAGTLAAIAAVQGVTRYGTIGVENPTGATDSYGNPAHSISMVVEGGLDGDVATAIYNNKTPGCLTNGTTDVLVTDSTNQSTMNINFFRPTYVPVYVVLNIHPLNVTYTTATTAAIEEAIVNYLNSLQIGEELTISALYGVAVSVMPNLALPQFSIKSLLAGTSNPPTTGNDVAVNFNQVISGSLANITVNLV